MSEKPRRGWIGLFFFVLAVSLLVSPAAFLLSMAVFRDKAYEIVEKSEGTPIVIIGAGNSGNQFRIYESDGGTLARTLVDEAAADTVSDDLLDRLYAAIEARALEGDVEAASVLARIAKLQRQPEAE